MALRFSSKSALAWLSNFSEHPIKLDGVTWASVEHYYQAQKYTEPAVIERIRGAATPLKARKAGQDRSLQHRADWEAIKERVMYTALLTKFTQHMRLQRELLSTDDQALIHESQSDLFWGQSTEGEGQNRLGVLLSLVRAALRTKQGP
jgi:N-glycosidase YbiA